MVLEPEKHYEAADEFLRQAGIRRAVPDEETLEAILRPFSRFPYENISKILKLNRWFLEPQRIRTPEEVVEDHIRFRLGGTCFSLTFTLQTILERVGFTCYPVMAHMRSGLNCHCALVVRLEGRKVLVDPGYLLHRPLVLDKDRRRLYHTAFAGVELRFDPADEHYHLYTFNRLESKWRYRFEDRPTPPVEFLQHWLDSFYRPTMHGICLSVATQDGLLYLHNDYFRLTTFDRKETRRVRQDLPRFVQQVFGIPAELVEEAERALEENLRLERVHGIYRPREPEWNRSQLNL
ncbi:MAG: arylamine N-acetyltransferase [candidate division KSB1 bacterium]|nr:arylamine N-acetyltransferase [candidate division KSB1 bacterium]